MVKEVGSNPPQHGLQTAHTEPCAEALHCAATSAARNLRARGSRRLWVEALGGLAMPSERLDDDIVRDPEKWLLREQAQAMLDLFAEDCGRTPVMLEEVREWARDQDEKHLRSRV